MRVSWLPVHQMAVGFWGGAIAAVATPLCCGAYRQFVVLFFC